MWLKPVLDFLNKPSSIFFVTHPIFSFLILPSALTLNTSNLCWTISAIRMHFQWRAFKFLSLQAVALQCRGRTRQQKKQARGGHQLEPPASVIGYFALENNARLHCCTDTSFTPFHIRCYSEADRQRVLSAPNIFLFNHFNLFTC